ncbi:hypothetical protein K3G63_21595 [Hymenobacter sp. HSC-4F20]|nr:hypothetical protein [Hymenobacter sp. HSC-4F20]MBX0293053.1 hypothetical protein [Hymenobacter sp. HSC-4F20]
MRKISFGKAEGVRNLYCVLLQVIVRKRGVPAGGGHRKIITRSPEAKA